MTNENYVGDRIKFFRKISELTLAQLAKSINSSAGFLSDIEKGKSLPSIPKLVEICSALNITLSDFFAPDGTTEPISEDLRELLRSVKGLSPEQIKAFTEAFKTIKKG